MSTVPSGSCPLHNKGKSKHEMPSIRPSPHRPSLSLPSLPLSSFPPKKISRRGLYQTRRFYPFPIPFRNVTRKGQIEGTRQHRLYRLAQTPPPAPLRCNPHGDRRACDAYHANTLLICAVSLVFLGFVKCVTPLLSCISAPPCASIIAISTMANGRKLMVNLAPKPPPGQWHCFRRGLILWSSQGSCGHYLRASTI